MSTREIPIDGPEQNMNAAHQQEGAAEATAESHLPELESPEARITALEEENHRLRDQALRAVADLENFRRRANAERQQVTLYANERLLKELLPLVDDIARSVESGGQAREFEGFYQGVSMINDKFKKMLDGLGVAKVPTVGLQFDVNLHEALMRQPSDAPEDTVIAELEPGYTYGERVLRHAKVIVSAGTEG